MVTFTITEVIYLTFGIFFGGYAIKALLDFTHEMNQKDKNRNQNQKL